MGKIVKVSGRTRPNPLDVTVGIVTSYVANNRLSASDLLALITQTYTALCEKAHAIGNRPPNSERLTSAQIQSSITHHALISFEDGRSYKMLKRHLTGVGLTPQAYRAKWGLPADYPMVAAGYSEKRAALARGIGLGRRDRTAGE